MDGQRILIVRFVNELQHRELSQFRGAVINAVGGSDILFHNHQDNGFRYSYPLIQYKCIGGRAALVCIGDGTEAIGDFFANASFDVHLGDKRMKLVVESVDAKQFLMQCSDDMFSYSLHKWMPLNQENYTQYMALDGLVERTKMLESLLTANIISMAKGLGVIIDKQVVVSMQSVDNERKYMYKGIKMQCFDVEFKCNVSLPDFVGLGKGVSLGYGMVTMKKGNNKK